MRIMWRQSTPPHLHGLATRKYLTIEHASFRCGWHAGRRVEEALPLTSYSLLLAQRSRALDALFGQIRVVPDIVATERHSHVQSRDICVSAPTGSGKTLVFVLGVLQVS